MPITVDNISMSYKKKKGRLTEVISGRSFSAQSGKLTLITGRSGSGKTTLVNILSGLLRPTEGKVFYGATDIYALDDRELSRFRNEQIGCIPQGQSALLSLTVFENVLLPSAVYTAGGNRERALALLDEVGLGKLTDSYPDELSGGELRRLSIARALINEPSVIFADEPTNDLDDENAKSVLQLLRHIADSGKTVITVSHEALTHEFADVCIHIGS